MDEVRDAASDCRACDLWRHATQTVFGAGAESASIMLVGEQPGDQEDLAGQPFVGPAGRLLGEALTAAGLDRARVYVTNAVKHFKWTERGKRRIHKKPRVGEIPRAGRGCCCELAHVRPRAVVCLGTSAARAVLGQSVTLKAVRGRPIASALGPGRLRHHASLGDTSRKGFSSSSQGPHGVCRRPGDGCRGGEEGAPSGWARRSHEHGRDGHSRGHLGAGTIEPRPEMSKGCSSSSPRTPSF